MTVSTSINAGVYVIRTVSFEARCLFIVGVNLTDKLIGQLGLYEAPVR